MALPKGQVAVAIDFAQVVLAYFSGWGSARRGGWFYGHGPRTWLARPNTKVTVAYTTRCKYAYGYRLALSFIVLFCFDPVFCWFLLDRQSGTCIFQAVLSIWRGTRCRSLDIFVLVLPELCSPACPSFSRAVISADVSLHTQRLWHSTCSRFFCAQRKGFKFLSCDAKALSC